MHEGDCIFFPVMHVAWMTCRQLIRTWVREVEVADAVYEASAEAISKACSLQVNPHTLNIMPLILPA